MKLFEMKGYTLQVSEEAWGYIPFKKILDRDKSKNKEIAFKEMLFIWSFCDIKSNYNYMTDLEVRTSEIKKDIGLPDKWKKDKVIEEAILFYNKMSKSIIEELYEGAVKAATDVNEYLKQTDILLKSRTNAGTPVYKISDITNGLKSIKVIMRDLKEAYKEVVKEKEDLEGKKKGSKEFNIFEEGLNID